MDLELIKKTRAKQRLAQQKAKREYEQSRVNTELQKSVEAVTQAVKSSDKVKITNPDLAKSGDFKGVKDSIDELNLTTFMASQQWLNGLSSVVNNLTELAKDIESIHNNTSTSQAKSSATFDTLTPMIGRLESLAKEIKGSKVEVDTKLANSVADAVKGLNDTIAKIDFNPKIEAPKIDVPAPKPPDLSPLVKSMDAVNSSITKLKFPENTIDLLPLQQSMGAVNKTLQNLKFPVPNYVLPYKDTGGKGVQAPVPLFDVPFDYLGFTNADANGNYQTWTLKQGGSSGTAVRTFTVSYDGSSNITSIGRN